MSHRRQLQFPQVLAITGLSGSGKTHVERALEDLGWLCVDNLPTALIPRFAEFVRTARRFEHAALVVDIREPDFVTSFPRVLRELRRRGFSVGLLFLEAEEKVLVRRFSETRRPHPLAPDEPALEGIREERLALAPIRRLADQILDTSDLTVHELRDWAREQYAPPGEQPGLVVTVTSFGYKHGLPAEADLVFDVRFLPNPNFVPRLQGLTGRDAAVVRYMKRQPETSRFLSRTTDFVQYLLPHYEREGKSYLTIAIGCTGGRHRSVMIAEALARAIGRAGRQVRVRHRDVRLAVRDRRGSPRRRAPRRKAARRGKGGA